MLEHLTCQADTTWEQLADIQTGLPCLLPLATARALRAQGMRSLQITISLYHDDNADQSWLTVTEAARKLTDDFCGSVDLAACKARVSNACKNGAILSTGDGTARRLNPTSFDAWRLKQRDRETAREARRDGDDD